MLWVRKAGRNESKRAPKKTAALVGPVRHEGVGSEDEAMGDALGPGGAVQAAQ